MIKLVRIASYNIEYLSVAANSVGGNKALNITGHVALDVAALRRSTSVAHS